MKRYFPMFAVYKFVAFISLLILPLSLLAKEISLYEQPKTDAKVVATVDLSKGVIPIYTPKEGSWLKVADPRNGNVGWIQSKNLSDKVSSRTTFTMQTYVSDNKSPVTYQIVRIGEPKNLSPEQTQAIMNQVQKQRQEIQKSMDKMMQDMNQLFSHEWSFMQDDFHSFFMPIFVVPEQTLNETQSLGEDKNEKK